LVLDDVSDNYLRFNTLQTKDLIIVVKIPGIDLLTNAITKEIPRYGDPIVYGGAGLFYGQAIPVANQRAIIADQSALTITQKIEPEQGRGSISTLTMSFIDEDLFMSQVISPGVIIDDIMGKEVEVFAGYDQVSFPEDYFRVFRGRVSGTKSAPGLVTLQFSDPNIKRNERIFRVASSPLSSAIGPTATSIFVINNDGFHKQILGPDATFDPAIKTFLIIEDEIIEYPATGFGANVFTSVIRGARGTTAVAHDIDVEVSSAIQIEDNLIDMALKLMLSGFNGDWITGQPILNFGQTGDPSLGPGGIIDDAIILPGGVDGVRDLGLFPGDTLTIVGSGSGNDGTVIVNSFLPLFGEPNRIIRTDTTFTEEIGTSATYSIRSQFDVYPITAGVSMNPPEIDIDQHILIRNTFLSATGFTLRFFETDSISCKAFIETEIFLPAAVYSLTRQGKISANITKPPLADQRLQYLNEDNILNPNRITTSRAINNRKYFNEIEFQWDFSDSGKFLSRQNTIDTNALNITKISKVLPIKSKGGKSDLGFEATIDSRTTFLLNRYSRGAVLLDVQTNWEVGALIEAGDVIVLTDNGTLKITNINTGLRDFGEQLLEVLNRKLDLKNGNAALQLLTGIGAALTDRFATIAPSSLLGAGSTTTRLIVKDSFGAIFPDRERDKYKDYLGLPIKVHNDDFTFEEIVTLVSLPLDNLNAIEITPALSISPPEKHTIDIADYSTSTDPTVNALYKLIHAHITPSVTVVSGVSSTVFTVSAGDALKFNVGLPVLIHNADFTIESIEALVVSVVSTTITVDTALGFTPAAGQTVELIGFADLGQPYRFI